MIEVNDYKKAKNYLIHILHSDIAEEINELIKTTEAQYSKDPVDEKSRKQMISENLKTSLSKYQRGHFYGQVKTVVDYSTQFDLNKNIELENDQAIIQKVIEKMEGILVSASYMAVIHGYTRQNIHVLIKKYEYQNYLVGQTLAFKLMDII